jgi:hypothetical protein
MAGGSRAHLTQPFKDWCSTQGIKISVFMTNPGLKRLLSDTYIRSKEFIDAFLMFNIRAAPQK